jgi:hypothetical protein
VLLLTTAAHPTIVKWRHPNLGRLAQPRDCARVAETAAAGIPWAADNDAYNDSYSDEAFERMLAAIRGVPGALFVAAPDVVGDSHRTALLYEEWAPLVMRDGHRCAWVAQDGLEGVGDAPWGAMDALFVGGTDAFKGHPLVAELVAEANRRGKWAHMGRVNTARRIRYAGSIGCDSFDGSKYSRWRDTWLPDGLAMAAAPRQMVLGDA